MSAADIVNILVGNAVLFGLLQFAATIWLKARLEASIRHEYDRRLEDYRSQLARRDRASLIAELFAEWVAREAADRKKLNRLIWEATLWLPAKIVKDIHKRLLHVPGAPNVEQILVEVRRHLHEATSDDITADDIRVYFPVERTDESKA